MAYYCYAVAVSKSQVSEVELQAIRGGFSTRRLDPIILPITEKDPVQEPSPTSVNETPVEDCPRISVVCPDESRKGNTPLRFQVSITGGKPRYEITYNWSVSKGTISFGQGTAKIEVTGEDLEGATDTVEVGGFEPSCNRVASCTWESP